MPAVVLIGAHLDSWDLGTGAVDDAAGVGITGPMLGELLGYPPGSTSGQVRVSTGNSVKLSVTPWEWAYCPVRIDARLGEQSDVVANALRK